MSRGLTRFIVVSVLCAQRLLAQETHSHPAPEKLGTVKFATSCAASVARDFERAVALLHSFAYDASAKAFREVSAADPSCAMAHWGAAMSYYHQLWSPPELADLQQGQAEAKRASELPVATPRERFFIAAIAAYYADYEHSSPMARAQTYQQSMSAAAASLPADIEVQAFYALSLIATAPSDDRSHLQQRQAAQILEPIYRDYPDHPGIAHYLIHNYDNAEMASRGLPAARAYSKIAPSAPHALHMPSHIFTRLGLWDDSIASNLAARAAARAQGDVGEELHAMDYLVYAYLQRDQRDAARQVVTDLGLMANLSGSDFKVGYAATAMPARLTMERQDWSAAADLTLLPDSVPSVAAIVFWAHAVAAARAGHPQTGDDDVAHLKTCLQQLQAAHDTYWATQVHVLLKEAEAWRSAALHTGDPVQLLRQAADEEDTVEKRPVTPGPIIPAREQLGDLLVALGRPREALLEYQAVLRDAPGRRGARIGAAQATHRSHVAHPAGKMLEAKPSP